MADIVVADIDGARLVRILMQAAVTLEDNKDYLCKLDSEVGDGDHGVSVTIAMRAARKNLAALQDTSPTAAFAAVSEAFADEVGASIGPLYEEAFRAASATVEGQADISDVTIWARILEAMTEAMQRVGEAKPGDKTLIDAWHPAAQAMRASADRGMDLMTSFKAASQAAWEGVEATKELVPKLGRASRLGERARGYQDAGATSASLLIQAIYEGVCEGVYEE